jgi:hypothetical protein
MLGSSHSQSNARPMYIFCCVPKPVSVITSSGMPRKTHMAQRPTSNKFSFFNLLAILMMHVGWARIDDRGDLYSHCTLRIEDDILVQLITGSPFLRHKPEVHASLTSTMKSYALCSATFFNLHLPTGLTCALHRETVGNPARAKAYSRPNHTSGTKYMQRPEITLFFSATISPSPRGHCLEFPGQFSCVYAGHLSPTQYCRRTHPHTVGGLLAAAKNKKVYVLGSFILGRVAVSVGGRAM